MSTVKANVNGEASVEGKRDERAETVGKLPANDEPGGTGNIDKIRDILFGVQMRDYEKRFARLEERLMKESSDLRDETRKRFDSLEQYIKQEMEALVERVTAEQNTRSESFEQLSQGIKETTRAFEKRAAQMDEQTARGQRELRQQLLDQSKSLSDEIRQKHQEMLQTLEREATELRADKTDRAALAGLFTEVAMRLTNDFKIPGDE
jgi:DNA repair exonuclease SbcCD ATPase subunit